MDEGYFKVWRALFDHPVWTCSTSDHKAVLMALLSMVNHSPNKWEWKGQVFEVQPGQVITSLQRIAERTGNPGKRVSMQSARTALNKFEKLEFLTNESTKSGRLITLVNWGLYNGTDSQANKGNNKELTKHQQSANKELTTNKNDKNDKNDKKEKKSSPRTDYSALPYGKSFSIFWEAYPIGENKKGSYDIWARLKPDWEFLDVILKAIEAQKKTEKWINKIIPHPTTWLNQRRWEDEVETKPQGLTLLEEVRQERQNGTGS